MNRRQLLIGATTAAAAVALPVPPISDEIGPVCLAPGSFTLTPRTLLAYPQIAQAMTEGRAKYGVRMWLSDEDKEKLKRWALEQA